MQAQTNSTHDINQYTSPYNQQSTNSGQAHITSGNNGFNYPPFTSATNTNGYFPTAPPPAAYLSPHPIPNHPQETPYNSPPRPPNGMFYHTPLTQPQEIFLGFIHEYSTSRPVYGPPGANFDSRGNLYFQHEDGYKEWIGPWRSREGNITKNLNQRNEEDPCSYF